MNFGRRERGFWLLSDREGHREKVSNEKESSNCNEGNSFAGERDKGKREGFHNLERVLINYCKNQTSI